jgi:predicted O-methyltransferase YrrM
MTREWTGEKVQEAARSYRSSCVLAAAAELDVIGTLDARPRSAHDLARAIEGDERATTILVDALTALGLLSKRDGIYQPAAGVAELFTEGNPRSLLPMLRHQANCLRSWAHLAEVVRSGKPHHGLPSVRGADEDRRSFIEAMRVSSRDTAPRLVAGLELEPFDHLLDVGGGPGTWTLAFLRAHPEARATLYDLPEVIPIARRHVEAAGLTERVTFVAGDLAVDPELPGGVDLVWISAIAHMNSRPENRALYARAYRALVSGGRVLIRDIVMDETHTSPPGGTLFAVNMLVNTPGGGTYSLADTTEDLQAAGFGPPDVLPGTRDMDWVITAARP